MDDPNQITDEVEEQKTPPDYSNSQNAASAKQDLSKAEQGETSALTTGSEQYSCPPLLKSKQEVSIEFKRKTPLSFERAIPLSSERMAPPSSERAISLSSERAILPSSERVMPLSSERMAPPLSERVMLLSSVRAMPLSSERVIPLSSEGIAPPSSERATPLSSERVIPLSSERIAQPSSERAIPLSSERIAPLSSERVTPLSFERESPISTGGETSVSPNLEMPFSSINGSPFQPECRPPLQFERETQTSPLDLKNTWKNLCHKVWYSIIDRPPTVQVGIRALQGTMHIDRSEIRDVIRVYITSVRDIFLLTFNMMNTTMQTTKTSVKEGFRNLTVGLASQLWELFKQWAMCPTPLTEDLTEGNTETIPSPTNSCRWTERNSELLMPVEVNE